MAGFKQTALTTGAVMFIENVTGQQPYVEYGEVNKISWQPGQAKIFADYLMEPSDAGVEIDLKPVISAIALKKGLIFLGAYTALVFGLTKYLGK